MVLLEVAVCVGVLLLCVLVPTHTNVVVSLSSPPPPAVPLSYFCHPCSYITDILSTELDVFPRSYFH